MGAIYFTLSSPHFITITKCNMKNRLIQDNLLLTDMSS